MSKERLIEDPELFLLMGQSSTLLGKDNLDRLLNAQQRFNHEVHVGQADGTIRVDKNFHIKRILEQIPDYLRSSESVALDSTQATDILVTIADSDPYEMVPHDDLTLTGLAVGFDRTAEKGERFSEDVLKKFKNMIALASKYGVAEHAITGYIAAQRVGLSIKDSADLLMHLPKADGIMAGYSFANFNDALKSLANAKVNPKLVKKVFKLLGGKRPYSRGGAYNMFETFITLGSPRTGISPQAFLESFFTQRRKEEGVEEFLSRFFDESQFKLPTSDVEIIRKIPKEEYFVEKTGKVEQAALPYRLNRSLTDGIKDLQGLANAWYHKYEDVGLGFWTYDPAKEIWYSFGGKLNLSSGRILQYMWGYDISDLSDTPMLFHVNPEEFEIMFMSSSSGLVHSEEAEYLDKFLSATPSRMDVKTVASLMERARKMVHPRLFIASSLGITELRYPDNIEEIKKLGETARDIKDQVIMNYNWHSLNYRRIYGQPPSLLETTQELITSLNKRLPDGFSVVLHPYEDLYSASKA